jgi:putative tricarboxylic transport membrane protein
MGGLDMLRRTFTAGAAALCGLLTAGIAQAQDMRAPEGPIEFTVGSAAGGTPDVIMRTFAQIMNEQGIVPNPIVVQNRSGAGHSNAYNHVLGLPGDENTLLTLASPVFTTPIVQGTPSVIDQITPIALLVQSELMLFTTPDSEFNSLQDVVAAATAEPGRIRVAGGASGGNDHILTGLVEEAGGVTMTYIPHESGGDARATFLGGNVELHFATLSEGLEMITAGTGKPLAIFSAERRPEEALAGIPTATEQGVDVLYTQFWGVGGPAGLDPAVAAWWADKFQQAAASEQFQAWLAENLYRSDMVTLADAGTYFGEQQQTFRDVLTRVGLAK